MPLRLALTSKHILDMQKPLSFAVWGNFQALEKFSQSVNEHSQLCCEYKQTAFAI